MVKISIAKKLSMKALVGNVRTYLKDLQNGQDTDLVRVIGMAQGLQHGESNLGPWTALMGDFVAEPIVGDKAGKRYRTGKLFLPDVALNLVTSAVNNLEKGSSIQLAFTIGVEADDTAAQGYVYTAGFLMEPEENDPMEQLMKKALPSPKQETVDPKTGEIKEEPVKEKVTGKA